MGTIVSANFADLLRPNDSTNLDQIFRDYHTHIVYKYLTNQSSSFKTVDFVYFALFDFLQKIFNSAKNV